MRAASKCKGGVALGRETAGGSKGKEKAEEVNQEANDKMYRSRPPLVLVPVCYLLPFLLFLICDAPSSG